MMCLELRFASGDGSARMKMWSLDLMSWTSSKPCT